MIPTNYFDGSISIISDLRVLNRCKYQDVKILGFFLYRLTPRHFLTECIKYYKMNFSILSLCAGGYITCISRISKYADPIKSEIAIQSVRARFAGFMRRYAVMFSCVHARLVHKVTYRPSAVSYFEFMC